MKKAFTLFELIIVIVIISIIVSYLVVNSNDSISFTQNTSIKSDIALIRSAIQREKSKNVLLQKEEFFYLDKAIANKKDEELFANILKIPLVSTSDYEKEIAKWIKLSSNRYKIYINSDFALEFEFRDGVFTCKSEVSLCKEYE